MKCLTLASMITLCGAAQSALPLYSRPEQLALPENLIKSPCKIPLENAKFNDWSFEEWQITHARAKRDLFNAFNCLSRHKSINLHDMMKIVKRQILVLAGGSGEEQDRTDGLKADVLSSATEQSSLMDEADGPSLLFNKLAQLELFTNRCGKHETDSSAFYFLQEIILQMQEMGIAGCEKNELSFSFLTAQLSRAIENVIGEIEKGIEELKSDTDSSAGTEKIHQLSLQVDGIINNAKVISECVKNFSTACHSLLASISTIEENLDEHDFFEDVYTNSVISKFNEILGEYRTAVAGICGSITAVVRCDTRILGQDTLNGMLSRFNCVGSAMLLFVAFKPTFVETYLFYSARFAHSLTHLGMNLLMSIIQLDEEQLKLMSQCLSKENLDFWEKSNLREYFDINEICSISEDNLLAVLSDKLAQEYDSIISEMETGLKEMTFKDGVDKCVDKSSSMEVLASLSEKLEEEEKMLVRLLSGDSLERLLGKVSDCKSRIASLIESLNNPVEEVLVSACDDTDVTAMGENLDIQENDASTEALENTKMSPSSVILILSFALVLILFIYSLYGPAVRTNK